MLFLIQAHEKLQQGRVIRRAQSRNRIPARNSRKAIRAATRIGAISDIVEDPRVSILFALVSKVLPPSHQRNQTQKKRDLPKSDSQIPQSISQPRFSLR
jgi:hypothetical protein